MEMEWVVKIILKDMKMGLNHGPLLRWFHRDAAKHFDGCQNLRTVCEDLAEPEWVFSREIKLNDVISPMLAQRCTWSGQMVQIAKDIL
jgi:DNA ligase-4